MKMETTRTNGHKHISETTFFSQRNVCMDGKHVVCDCIVILTYTVMASIRQNCSASILEYIINKYGDSLPNTQHDVVSHVAWKNFAGR